MAQRYCKRGHDTDEVGRVQRMCRECRRLSDRRRYGEKRRAQSRRWWHSKGYLRRLNRTVDIAVQKMAEFFG